MPVEALVSYVSLATYLEPTHRSVCGVAVVRAKVLECLHARALFLVTPDLRFFSEDAMVLGSLFWQCSFGAHLNCVPPSAPGIGGISRQWLVRLYLRRWYSLVFVDLSFSLCTVLCHRL